MHRQGRAAGRGLRAGGPEPAGRSWRFLALHTDPALLLGLDGEQASLPEEVYRVLIQVVEALRDGKVITAVPGCSGLRRRKQPISWA
jgi:hypothetical protein